MAKNRTNRKIKFVCIPTPQDEQSNNLIVDVNWVKSEIIIVVHNSDNEDEDVDILGD